MRHRLGRDKALFWLVISVYLLKVGIRLGKIEIIYLPVYSSTKYVDLRIERYFLLWWGILTTVHSITNYCMYDHG